MSSPSPSLSPLTPHPTSPHPQPTYPCPYYIGKLNPNPNLTLSVTHVPILCRSNRPAQFGSGCDRRRQDHSGKVCRARTPLAGRRVMHTPCNHLATTMHPIHPTHIPHTPTSMNPCASLDRCTATLYTPTHAALYLSPYPCMAESVGTVTRAILTPRLATGTEVLGCLGLWFMDVWVYFSIERTQDAKNHPHNPCYDS